MEFLFLLIGLLSAVAMLAFIPYLMYGKWSLVKRVIKDSFTQDSGFFGVYLIFIGIMTTMFIFVALCALNNSIWHLDYYTMKGNW